MISSFLGIFHRPRCLQKVTSQSASLSATAQETISRSHCCLSSRKGFTFDIDSPLIALTPIASEQFNGRCLCVVNKLHFFSMVEVKAETNLEGEERLSSIRRLMNHRTLRESHSPAAPCRKRLLCLLLSSDSCQKASFQRRIVIKNGCARITTTFTF